jgi:ketosteroid isomerase-like protein
MATQFATDNETSARAVFESFSGGDLARLRDLLADDVVLRSPITERLRFRGRDRVLDIIAAVRSVTNDVERTHLTGSGDTWVQVVRGTAGRRPYHLSELIEFDDTGRIRELTVFIRPMPALVAFAAAVVPVAARRRGRGASLALSAMVKPLVPLVEQGDRVAIAVLRDAWS